MGVYIMKSQAKSIDSLPHGFKIIHVLPDGTEVESIKGMYIPYIPETKTVYELAIKYSK
jgi:hypothetical protein